MGNFAQNYEEHIAPGGCIIKTSHPSPFSYKTKTKNAKAFSGSKVFEEINNELWVQDKKIIKW